MTEDQVIEDRADRKLVRAFHRGDNRPEKHSSPVVPCGFPQIAFLRNRHSPNPLGSVRLSGPYSARLTRKSAITQEDHNFDFSAALEVT